MTDLIPLPNPSITITCPACKTPGAHLVGYPIPHTDDYADCAQCPACQHIWSLDPGANGACTQCGGSGDDYTITPTPASVRHPRSLCSCHHDYDLANFQIMQLVGSDIHADEPPAYTSDPHDTLKALSVAWTPAPTRWQRLTQRIRHALHLAA